MKNVRLILNLHPLRIDYSKIYLHRFKALKGMFSNCPHYLGRYRVVDTITTPIQHQAIQQNGP